MSGDMNIRSNQQNAFIKAVNEEKQQKCEKDCKHQDCFGCCCLESLAAKPSLYNSLHQEDCGQIPANFQAKKSQTIKTGLISTQGRCRSPHRCFSPGLQKWQRCTVKIIHQPPYLPDIAPAVWFLCWKWRLIWPASCCPRRASRQARMGSSELSPKTSPPLPFDGK